LIVDVGGVGYLVQVTPSVLHRPGDEVTVETYMHVREDALQLFGFGSAEERDLFVHLLSVNGVGPKVALAIVSGSTPAELRRAHSTRRRGSRRSPASAGRRRSASSSS